MSLVPEHIKKLKPYIAGKPIEELERQKGINEIVKLASNENPLGPSVMAINNCINYLNSSNRYPDSSGFILREKLAKKFNLNIDNVILGSGSEGIMSAIMRTFLSDFDEIISTKNSFIGFRVLANASGMKTHWVDMNNFHYDLSSIAKHINSKTKIIYLANPDNPTGTYFKKDEFDSFIYKVPERVLIILDEAYFEYVSRVIDYPNSMDYRYDNVITLRTFSKAYGLSGFRIGYGFGHKYLINNLMKVKLPFEPSSPAQYAAISAMDDHKHLSKTLENNRIGKEFLIRSFKRMKIEYIDSVTNFITILFKSKKNAVDLNRHMLNQGIILRHLGNFGISNAIRITIGTPHENEKLIKAMELHKK